jgi:predicted DNA-binding transcriptional regulator AlpA
LPKLERLLKLAQMTCEQRAGTVREMSQACGVSQRTIFRYLNTLSSLNVPDELRVGKRMSSGESESREIDRDDQCLLCFALDHNPLVQYQYLASRLGRIKRILSGGRLPGGGILQGSVIEVETSPRPRKKTAGDRILSAFMAACQSGDYLLVKVRGSDREATLRPHAIKIQSTGISLSFRGPSRRQYVAHNLSSITSVRGVRKAAGPRSR